MSMPYSDKPLGHWKNINGIFSLPAMPALTALTLRVRSYAWTESDHIDPIRVVAIFADNLSAPSLTSCAVVCWFGHLSLGYLMSLRWSELESAICRLKGGRSAFKSSLSFIASTSGSYSYIHPSPLDYLRHDIPADFFATRIPSCTP
jgi:hypothetical protein